MASARAFALDVEALAVTTGTSVTQLRQLLATASEESGTSIPFSATIVLPGDQPPLSVRLPPLQTQCALVVTSQFGYSDENAAQSDRRGGQRAAWRAEDREGLPNELKHFQGRPIVASCVEQLFEAGITKLIVVVFQGDNGKRIVQAINQTGIGERLDLQYVYMPRATNHGASIIAARSYLPSKFLLVAADHIISPRLLRRMGDLELHEDEAGCVALERDLSRLQRVPMRSLFDMYARVSDEKHVSAVGACSSETVGRLHLKDRAVPVHPDRGNDGLVAGLMLLTRRVVEALIDLSCMDHEYTLAEAIDPFAQCGQLLYCPVGDDSWFSAETFDMASGVKSEEYAASSTSCTLFDGAKNDGYRQRRDAGKGERQSAGVVHSAELIQPLLEDAEPEEPTGLVPAVELPGTVRIPSTLAGEVAEPTLLMAISSLARVHIGAGLSDDSFRLARQSTELVGELVRLPIGRWATTGRAEASPFDGGSLAHLPVTADGAVRIVPLSRAAESLPMGMMMAVRDVPPHTPALLVQIPPDQGEPLLRDGGMALLLLEQDSLRPVSLISLPSAVLAMSVDAVVHPEGEEAATLSLTLQKRVPLVAWALICVAVVCGALQGEMMALQQGVQTPPLKMVWRLTLASLLLLPIAIREARQERVARLLMERDTWVWMSMCTFGLVANLTLFVLALGLSSVPQVALFQNTSPVFIVLYKLFNGVHLHRAEISGTCLTLAGAIASGVAALDSSDSNRGTGASALLGNLLALLAAICDTAYYVGAKRLRNELPIMLFFWLLFAQGAIVLGAGLWIGGMAEFSMDANAGIFGWLQMQRLPTQASLFVVGDLGSTVNFVAVLKYFDPLIVTVFLLMQPVVASVFEIATIGESAIPSPAKLLGSLLVLAGVLILVVSSSGEETEHVETSKVLSEISPAVADGTNPKGKCTSSKYASVVR